MLKPSIKEAEISFAQQNYYAYKFPYFSCLPKVFERN